MKLIKRNWKPFVLGVISGIVLIFALVSLLEEDSVESDTTPSTELLPVENVSSSTNETESSIGTLTNPLPLQEEGNITIEDPFTEESFNITFEVLKFESAENLAGFEPQYYNDITLVDGYTYYGLNVKISVVETPDKNTTYDFDALNNMNIYVDGAESSYNVIDIESNQYSGIDGSLAQGASKEGWVGFQAPSDAKEILIKVGGYASDYFVKLK